MHTIIHVFILSILTHIRVVLQPLKLFDCIIIRVLILEYTYNYMYLFFILL